MLLIGRCNRNFSLKIIGIGTQINIGRALMSILAFQTTGLLKTAIIIRYPIFLAGVNKFMSVRKTLATPSVNLRKHWYEKHAYVETRRILFNKLSEKVQFSLCAIHGITLKTYWDTVMWKNKSKTVALYIVKINIEIIRKTILWRSIKLNWQK